MAEAATLKIVIADDPSSAKPSSGATRATASDTAPAGSARELAGRTGRPSSGGAASGAVGGTDSGQFADLAKSLGLTARELQRKANEPGFAELIAQLPKEPSAARESATAPGAAGTAREQAGKPDTAPIDAAIDEVFERFRMGLLSLEEAQARLDRFAKSEKVVDQLRDQFGGDTDPAKLFEKLLKEEGAKREVPTRARPAEVEILDEKKAPGASGIRSLLDQFRPLLDQIPGAGRALAAMDKVGPAVERFAPGLGSLVGRGTAPGAARAAATGGESAGAARTVAKAVPTAAAEGGAGAEAGVAAGAGEAAGAAAGMAELAAVAGPAALAIIAVKIAGDEMAGAIDNVRGSVKFAGDAMAGVARNEIMGTFSTATENAAKSVEDYGLVGKVAAAEIRLFSQTVQSARQTLDAFANRGRELAQYDARAALASNREDTAGILSDIREGRELGADYGRIIDARREIDTEMRDIMLEMKKAVLPLIATIAENASAVVNTVGPVVEEGIKTIAEGIQVMAAAASAAKKLSGIELILKGIHALVGDATKKAERKEIKTGYQQIHEMAELLGKDEKAKPDPTDVAASQKLNVPLLS